MEIQSNIEKAREIAECCSVMPPTSITQSDVIAMTNNAAMQAMEWKQQQLIDKAMKVICNGCAQKVECKFKNWETCDTKDELIKSMEE